MSLSDRRQFLATLGLIPLAACGFTPLYSENSPASAMNGRIALDIERSRMGFAMRERLESRLGVAQIPEYRLTIVLSVKSEDTVIQRDNSITRYTLRSFADYTLTQGDKTVLRDQVQAVTAYNATASPFATDAAERDARQRLAFTLADQIVTRLASSAGDWLT